MPKIDASCFYTSYGKSVNIKLHFSFVDLYRLGAT